MEMKTKVIYSVIGGIIISLITGLFQSPFYMILGANYYGVPFPWLSQMVLGPGYTAPYNVIWFSVFFNTVIWAVVVFIGIELFEIGTKKEIKHKK
jgi:hypothetical protein